MSAMNEEVATIEQEQTIVQPTPAQDSTPIAAATETSSSETKVRSSMLLWKLLTVL